MVSTAREVISQPITVAQAQEWQDAADYFARFGRLPQLMDARVCQEIDDHPDEWDQAVRAAQYARAMMEHGQ